jgi:excisionase family DNA binding protein
MPEQLSALLTSADVSDRLLVPTRTLDQWAYQHKGPAYIRVGRHRRYRLEDVEAWLDAHTVETSAA